MFSVDNSKINVDYCVMASGLKSATPPLQTKLYRQFGSQCNNVSLISPVMKKL